MKRVLIILAMLGTNAFLYAGQAGNDLIQPTSTGRFYEDPSGNFTFIDSSTGPITLNTLAKGGSGVPYSGAAQSISLGSFGITASSFTGSGLALTGVAKSAGILTGANATAGDVGEYKSSTTAAATNFTSSGTFINFLNISISSGDYDINALAIMNNGGTKNIGNFYLAISTVSGNFTGDLIEGDNYAIATSTNVMENFKTPIPLPCYRTNYAYNATLYLKAKIDAYNVEASTPTVEGAKLAVRRAH